MALIHVILAAPLLIYLVVMYFQKNDRCLRSLPEAALKYSPKRLTSVEIDEADKKLRENPVDIATVLPPKTGRRYIIIGGAGFLGGWIVVHLLRRGEDPRKIRVLDIRYPTRDDLTTGKAAQVDFRIVDISDAEAVNAAFSAAWHDCEDRDGDQPDITVTVFHTAANIRFYERAKFLVPLSAKVNVQGTQNIINAACANGITTMIYTSSGSVSVNRSRFWLWPWEREPKDFVQCIDDDDKLVPKEHGGFFSNYAYTKRIAEMLVRNANGRSSGLKILRTGCLRPGNGIFGPGGDTLCGAYLVRKTNPTWITNIVQNCIYVENCSLAHLCYEQCLNEVAQGSANPDISGQAFCVADPGPPLTYGDIYVALSHLSKGKTVFPEFPPSLMLFLSQIIELWYLTRHLLSKIPGPIGYLANCLPKIGGDLVNLQPSLFALISIHLIFDDSRARLSPSEGGLGYKGQWTTLEGVCKLVDEFEKSGGKVEARHQGGGGVDLNFVSFGFGLVRAERGVGKIVEEVQEVPEKVLN